MLKSIALGTALIAFGTGGALAADEPLTSTLNAYVITVDENGEEVRTESEDIAPDQLVEYELTYENVSEGPLTGLVVSAPIPAATTFVAGSANTNTDALFEVSADDGATWAVPPLMTVTETGETAIDISEYDLVRWTPSNSIESSEEWKFTYRASVE